LELNNNNKISIFEYNRKHKGDKTKKIYLNDIIIDFSLPKNDPLSELIENISTGNIDFVDNEKLTIKTLGILEKIKENDRL
jgi:hypothetical protein